MTQPISDLQQLLRSLQPARVPGVFAFVSVQDASALKTARVYSFVAEPQGMSAIITEADAQTLGLHIYYRAAWITLTVNSDLHAVGLTAAFATALGQAQISCNVVAGAMHDHIFVPVERAQDALDVLHQLQASASQNH